MGGVAGSSPLGRNQWGAAVIDGGPLDARRRRLCYRAGRRVVIRIDAFGDESDAQCRPARSAAVLESKEIPLLRGRARADRIHSTRLPLCVSPLIVRRPGSWRSHHGITFRSFTNFAVMSCGASLASQTMPDAPSAIERVAFSPPISVRTQPGQTQFTAKSGSAAASWTVTPFSAVLETQYAGAHPSAPSSS